MFAYCRNNPVRRVDISGAADQDCYDNDPLDEEDILKTGEGGGGTTIIKSSQPHGNTFTSGNGTNSGSHHSPSSANYKGVSHSGKTEIHHIVEQCQMNKSGFSKEQIQASSNKVELDYRVHRMVSGYYSSKPPEYGGLRVRDWLAGQSFEFQTAFGNSVIATMYSRISK